MTQYSNYDETGRERPNTHVDTGERWELLPEDWREQYRSQWSDAALDTAENFSKAIHDDQALDADFSRISSGGDEFRPRWIENPHDGSAEKIVDAMNGDSCNAMTDAEKDQLTDRLALMMTLNVWQEVTNIESPHDPQSTRFHEELIDRMEDAVQEIANGIKRGDPATVVGALVDAAEYDRQARQYNHTGIVPDRN